MDTPDLYVPNLMSFQNDNIFLGSYNGLRFKLTPLLSEEQIHAEYWYGPLCYEKSQMDGEDHFPLTTEGITAMTSWIRILSEENPNQ